MIVTIIGNTFSTVDGSFPAMVCHTNARPKRHVQVRNNVQIHETRGGYLELLFWIL